MEQATSQQTCAVIKNFCSVLVGNGNRNRRGCRETEVFGFRTLFVLTLKSLIAKRKTATVDAEAASDWCLITITVMLCI